MHEVYQALGWATMMLRKKGKRKEIKSAKDE